MFEGFHSHLSINHWPGTVFRGIQCYEKEVKCLHQRRAHYPEDYPSKNPGAPRSWIDRGISLMQLLSQIQALAIETAG